MHDFDVPRASQTYIVILNESFDLKVQVTNFIIIRYDFRESCEYYASNWVWCVFYIGPRHKA